MPLTLKSCTSDAELSFYSDAGGYDLTVAFRSPDLSVTREIYTSPEFPGPLSLFAALAAETRPWVGSHEWESLEGELKLRVTCDSVGHVLFKIEIGKQSGPAPWAVNTRLLMELGQLPAVGRAAEAFFPGPENSNAPGPV